MNQIQWKYAKPVSNTNLIDDLEKQYNIKLPELYKELIKKHNGARPQPNVYDTAETKERTIKSLLSVNKEDDGNLLEVMNWLKGRLPSACVPFANDMGGNYLCYLSEDANNEAAVYFWRHEDGELEKVDDIFEGFLESLYLPSR